MFARFLTRPARPRRFHFGWLWLLLLTSPCLAAGLSSDEQRFVRQHPKVRMCVNPDWSPFEWINGRGQYQGIGADLVRLAARRVGLQLVLVPTRNWSESVQAAHDGRCQMLAFLNQTPERERWLAFTAPLFSDVSVLITREEHPPIDDLAALRGQSIAIPAGFALEERLRAEYPQLEIIHTRNVTEALRMVSERQATMTLRSLLVAAYTIKKEGWFNLKVAGELPSYTNRLRIGVRRGEPPQLLALLDKGVQSVSDSEREQIFNRNVPINVESAWDYVWLGALAAALGVLLLLVAGWNLRLKRHNRELEARSHTDALTGLPNRGALDLACNRELAHARRSRQPLALLLLDLDRFKAVNDGFGHLQGDQVLLGFADVLRGCVRQADSCGRWGGEEFLVLCPHTSEDAALVLAERIRQTVAATSFATGQQQTVSVGVALWQADDDIVSLLQRADQALYRAKRNGRNRVCGQRPPRPQLADSLA